MARAVERWTATALETAVVQAGGCAAEMRSIAAWQQHPQGLAVSREPLVDQQRGSKGPAPAWAVPPARPLDGVRVLDLTRVLAGPVATRFLAGYGAEVLRIGPPSWVEPGVVPEVTLGKRCARLDLRLDPDRATFEGLLARADVLLHGYRPGALDGLGFGAARRREIAPGLVDVSLSAYGGSGPWADRRGFDSLVQMSAGIAARGMDWAGADKPVPLPVQALDHATGYLMAAAALAGMTHRLRTGFGSRSRLSLARTAQMLVDHAAGGGGPGLGEERAEDVGDAIEDTDWGAARRIAPPAVIEGSTMRWSHPAQKLGSALLRWENSP